VIAEARSASCDEDRLPDRAEGWRPASFDALSASGNVGIGVGVRMLRPSSSEEAPSASAPRPGKPGDAGRRLLRARARGA
jgi:hypothetical protein